MRQRSKPGDQVDHDDEEDDHVDHDDEDDDDEEEGGDHNFGDGVSDDDNDMQRR